jgi:site-specific recombinase XerD
VFRNRRRAPITRFVVHATVTRYATEAADACPSLAKKAISPHVIRHTTATHLLRAGVDINTIRAWLGHVSIDTTNLYAEVDLETKAASFMQVVVELQGVGLERGTRCRCPIKPRVAAPFGVEGGPCRT